MHAATTYVPTSPNADTLTGAEYEIADKIQAALDKHPGAHTPSQVARWVHEDLHRTRPVLDWMAAHQNGAQDDGGSYGIRRFAAR